jgi:hypothetical protein
MGLAPGEAKAERVLTMNSALKEIGKRIKSWSPKTVIAVTLAVAGMMVYLAFSIQFAKTQRSTIDEGLFLYKGYLFANGTYRPFQDYGVRTQYGPLSYLVPGAIQMWFGPGLRTGRIFAIITGFLALVGLWAAANRLAGSWWALAVAWAAALNTAVIRFYSFGLSQGLVACLLMWMLFFVLGRNRSTWQTCLSAIIAGLILLTRQNMAPVLPILLVFIFWQYGRKQGFISLLGGAITVIMGHVVFWPGILSMWTPWLPASLTPFLNAWRLPAGVSPALNFQPNWSARLYSMVEGLRFHFVSLAGPLLGLVLWPGRKAWKSEQLFRSGVFLATLFYTLFVLHTWAGLGFSQGNNSNAFTFNPYLAFFSYLGLLLTIAIFSNIQRHYSAVRQVIVCVLILIFSTGIGYQADLYIPRVKSFFTTGKILPGYVPLWEFFSDKFGIPPELSRWLIPLLTGFLGGLLVLLIGYGLWSFLKRRMAIPLHSLGTISAAVFILTGIVLSPSTVLGGGFNQWACSENVIETYEQAGRYLAEQIPAGSTVYWRGGNAVAVLLYTPGIIIHPAQLDWEWNHWIGGNPDILARLGYWNDEMASQWLINSDFVLIQPAYNQAAGFVIPDLLSYTQSGITSQGMNCSQDSTLTIYRKR